MAKKKAPVARKASAKPKAKAKAAPKKATKPKRVVTGKGRGAPKFEVTPEIISKVETYASMGFKKVAIAKLLGIHYDTLNERCKENSDFSEAFTLGKIKGVVVATTKLSEKVRKGDLNAIKYYLNNQGKDPDLGAWSDKQEVALTTPEGLTFINHY
jgi:hypothetical protein